MKVKNHGTDINLKPKEIATLVDILETFKYSVENGFIELDMKNYGQDMIELDVKLLNELEREVG